MGRINADNLYCVTHYLVDPSAAQGAYTTIQSAIDDAFAAGTGLVVVKQGVYNENLVFRPSVNIFAMDVDARAPFADQVVVNGNHTFTAGGQFLVSNIQFNSAAGDTFTLTNTAPGMFSLGAFKYCGINSTGGRSFVCSDATGTGAMLGVGFETNATSDLDTVFLGTNGLFQITSVSEFQSNTAHVVNMSGTSQLNCLYSGLQGSTSTIFIDNASAEASIEFCDIGGNSFAIEFNAPGSATSFHNNYSCSGSGGFYVGGAAAGAYTYRSDNLFNNLDIALGVAQTTGMWRPTAVATTLADDRRGTASFDSTQFTVTDGFVQLINGLSGFTWIDRGVPVTVASFTGNFFTAATTLTLPLAPSQGDEVKFACDTGAGCVIQANGAQVIRVGNIASAAGGSATSTAQGDTLDLVYRAAAGEWISIATDGNWVIV